VFVSTNINLPYWREAEAGFLDAAKMLGVKAELIGPTTYDPDAEVGMFRKVVEQQPAGICVSRRARRFSRRKSTRRCCWASR